jgi:hypothetical protein
MEKQLAIEKLAIEEQAPTEKLNRHVVIALNHLKARRSTLLDKQAVIDEIN